MIIIREKTEVREASASLNTNILYHVTLKENKAFYPSTPYSNPGYTSVPRVYFATDLNFILRKDSAIIEDLGNPRNLVVFILLPSHFT